MTAQAPTWTFFPIFADFATEACGWMPGANLIGGGAKKEIAFENGPFGFFQKMKACPSFGFSVKASPAIIAEALLV